MPIPLIAALRSATWPLAAVALLCTGVLPACSKNDELPADAMPDAPIEVRCWSGGGTPTAGASITMGTGGVEFEPLEPEQGLPLYQGGQGGAHFFVHARISGISPGDASGRTAPPTYTRFSIYAEDGTDMTLQPCDYPSDYIENSDGSWQMPYARIVRLASPYLTSIYGDRVRLQVEVQDVEGRYASDERWVMVTDPEANGNDAGPSSDAGAPDAAPDAGATASR